MTIGELIKALQNYPADQMVVCRGYEAGYDNPLPHEVELVKDGNWEVDLSMPQGGSKETWYYGRHNDMAHYVDDEPVTTIKAICL